MNSRSLPLHFGPQQHAVQFRLTPQLKQALLDASANGEQASMRFTEGAGVGYLLADQMPHEGLASVAQCHIYPAGTQSSAGYDFCAEFHVHRTMPLEWLWP